MKKEKESGTLLGVGTAYLPVKEVKGEFYIKASDFTRCIDGMRKELEEENKSLKEENNRLKDNAMEDMRVQTKLEEENKKLNEFKNRREESMFYFKAQMERAEPKTAKEAEDLQKAKELFEKLYREELYYLEQENKELKENIKMLSGNIILG